MRTALFFFITVVTLRGGAPCESEARALRLTPAKAGVRAVLEACASSANAPTARLALAVAASVERG